MASKIRKDDQVIIIAGKYKGQSGTVLKVIPAEKTSAGKTVKPAKVLVQGINLVKKHQRPNPNRGVTGGIIEREMPLDVSNVAIMNNSRKADRVGFKILADGKKVRYFKSNNEVID